MNEGTKIILSADELSAVMDRSFFEKKSRITNKIYEAFAQVVKTANEQKIFSGIVFPQGTDFSTGKISKGENYIGLPYLLLDFPRNFKGDDCIAIRTMLWWGNFISSTLLISGAKTSAGKKSVIRHLSLLSEMKTWICIHESPWLHHFDADNYQPIHKLEKKEVAMMLESVTFVKLARKIPLRSINRLEMFTLDSFKLYRKILLDI